MLIYQAAILGLVQGVTEFVPISSSAHLIIVPYFLGWQPHTLTFDLVLHLGTALALIAFFVKDLVSYYLALVRGFLTNWLKFGKYSDRAKFGVVLLVSNVPAGLAGFYLGDLLEESFRGIAYVFWFLILGSVLMFVADMFFDRGVRKIEASAVEPGVERKVSFTKGLVIGLFQCLALLPGVSRAGATISAGMYFGLKREDAARFSFLLSVPLVVGAAIYEITKNSINWDSFLTLPLLAGFVTSFLVGLFAIRFLLNFLKGQRLWVFVMYRVVLIISLLTLGVKIP